MSYNR